MSSARDDVSEPASPTATTDRVREALFNSLDSHGLIEDAVVVDLYAGSGALGIEALSRGAARCTFVERDRSALKALRENIAALRIADRCTVVTSDVIAWLPAARGIDIALIDPPYTFDAWPELLGRLHAHYAVCESGREVLPPPGWGVWRSKRYGRTWSTVLEREGDE